MSDEKLHELDMEITKISSELRHTKEKLIGIEKNVESINSLVISIHEIASEVKTMRIDMKNLSDRIVTVEKQPAKRWDDLVKLIIAGAVGIVISSVSAFFKN